MSLSARYQPQETETKWYDYWLKKNYFHSEPDEREPFTVVIPPPNVTGVLHMGHMLNNTIQDILVSGPKMKSASRSFDDNFNRPRYLADRWYFDQNDVPAIK